MSVIIHVTGFEEILKSTLPEKTRFKFDNAISLFRSMLWRWKLLFIIWASVSANRSTSVYVLLSRLGRATKETRDVACNPKLTGGVWKYRRRIRTSFLNKRRIKTILQIKRRIRTSLQNKTRIRTSLQNKASPVQFQDQSGKLMNDQDQPAKTKKNESNL